MQLIGFVFAGRPSHVADGQIRAEFEHGMTYSYYVRFHFVKALGINSCGSFENPIFSARLQPTADLVSLAEDLKNFADADMQRHLEVGPREHHLLGEFEEGMAAYEAFCHVVRFVAESWLAAPDRGSTEQFEQVTAMIIVMKGNVKAIVNSEKIKHAEYYARKGKLPFQFERRCERIDVLAFQALCALGKYEQSHLSDNQIANLLANRNIILDSDQDLGTDKRDQALKKSALKLYERNFLGRRPA